MVVTRGWVLGETGRCQRTKTSSYKINTGWGKRRFTVVHMENNTIIINNNTRTNSVFCVLTTVNLLLPGPVCPGDVTFRVGNIVNNTLLHIWMFPRE